MNTSSSNETRANKTNLIVNYLPQSMTNDEFRTLFQSIGRLENCKLIKNKQNNQSLGYGFVNYSNANDAQKAINSFNGVRLENKILKVSYARPSSHSIKGANLYVSNLPKCWTVNDLDSYFEQCGKIVACRILFDQQTGESRSVGFVRFETRSEAEIAIQKLQGKTPNSNSSQALCIKFASSHLDLNNANLFSNLAAKFKAIKQSSENIFMQRFDSSSLNGDNLQDGYSISQHHTVVDAKNIYNSIKISGCWPFASCSSSVDSWTICVYNLAPETEESFLWQLFCPFGAVQNVKVVRNECMGLGLVTMRLYDEALSAINALNGLSIGNRVLQVSFKSN